MAFTSTNATLFPLVAWVKLVVLGFFLAEDVGLFTLRKDYKLRQVCTDFSSYVELLDDFESHDKALEYVPFIIQVRKYQCFYASKVVGLQKIIYIKIRTWIIAKKLYLGL